MDIVSFIPVESGIDLILSFAVQNLEDPAAIESLILMRAPKDEFILGEFERRVSVHFERHGDEEDDYLEAVGFLEAEQLVRIKTSLHDYELDVQKTDKNELKKMRQILHRMNFDKKFQILGV
jgi:hypothetical protein